MLVIMYYHPRMLLTNGMNEIVFRKNKESAERFHQSLASDDGRSALQYLHSRKISSDVISKFKLGWCPMNDPNVYMRGRITIPLRNTYGGILAFAGRIPTVQEGKCIVSIYDGEVIQEEQEDGKKIKHKLVWWHEPLAKRNYLYGFDQTFYDIRKENAAIVVEGEFDLWACYQGGLKNVVGILGSAFTHYQIGKLLGLCDNVIMLLDADEGGNKGWNLALENYEKAQGSYSFFNIDRMTLPDGYDPFSFIDEYGIDPLKQSYNHIVKSYEERVPF